MANQRPALGITRYASRIAVPSDTISMHTDVTRLVTRVIATLTRDTG